MATETEQKTSKADENAERTETEASDDGIGQVGHDAEPETQGTLKVTDSRTDETYELEITTARSARSSFATSRSTRTTSG